MIYARHYNSPVGKIYLTADDEDLTLLSIKGQRGYKENLPCGCCNGKNNSVLPKVCRWLDEYFAGRNPVIDFPLKASGTIFQHKVWAILRQIPYGTTITYGDIAQKIAPRGGKMSAQAVGGAVGHNPTAIIVPCHRVMGANGKLTGYDGGIDIKIKLLELEHALASK